MSPTLFARLFVSLAKLMAAEKMKLDKFCSPGEYLSYKVKISPSTPISITKQSDVEFQFSCEIERTKYEFTNKTTTKKLKKFETHLSMYLNILFDRKQEYENNIENVQDLFCKLTYALTIEEQQLLATQIDVNSSNVLKALGVKLDH